ncbi:ATP-binding protein [Leuconostoc mesenteroides]|uniref:ATP-binding protein n=1 Tax=Leuconostoc mesenteroides TaxID=1245 RepID=UPI00235FFC84|nr:ATP-binding protein [Leuconostoc mesenteroides]
MAKNVNVKYENPVVQYQNNLLLTTIGDVWAYYQLKPFQINVANAQDKSNFKETFVDVFERLQKYDDVDLKLIPVDMDLAGRIQGTSPDWAKDIADVAQYYMGQEEVDILESEFKPVIRDEFYIGVKLKNTSVGDDLKDKFQFATDLILRRLAETMRYQVKFDDKFFERYQTMNDDVLVILRPLDATKMSEEKLIDMLGSTYHHQGMKDFSNMRDTAFDLAKLGIVKRETQEETDYISHLVLNLPDRLDNLALIPELQSFKFPVEVHFKINFPQRDGFKGMKQETRSSKGKYKDELEDALLSDDDSSKRSRTNFALAQDLADVMDSKDAFMQWLLVLVIRDDDVQRLKTKIREVKTRLSTFNREIDVFQPSFNQELLLYQNLPATNLGVFKRWRQFTNAPALAQLMFGTSHELGSRTGFYIGRVLDTNRYFSVDSAVASSRTLLLINPVIANKGIVGAKTDSPHIAITGDTGQGKSFLVKILLNYLAMFDVKLLYVDPKQEVRRWFKASLEDNENPFFTKLMNSFHYVTLNANDSANCGVLDPMLTLNGQSTVDEIPSVLTLVKEMLVQVRSISQDMELDTALTNAIKQICNQRLAGEQVGTMAIIEILKAGNEKSQQLANYYESVIPDSMLKLAFSDGQTDSIEFNNQRTILEVTGLDLPYAEQEVRSYTETQKYSVSIMLALGKYLEKFGREDTKRFSAEIIDEAWIFNASPAGRKVLDGIKRLGRSENNMLIYSTQRVGDVNDEKSNGQYGQIFAFDSADDSERENILRHFGLPVNKSNMDMLKDLKKGQCLFRDIYGRVGKVVIHSLFEEWTKAFKTVDKNAGAELEAKYG